MLTADDVSKGRLIADVDLRQSPKDAGCVMRASGGAALGFAVRDMGFNVGFMTPSRYGMDTVHARSPFPYFTEATTAGFSTAAAPYVR